MSKAENPNQDICDMLIKLGEHERDVNGIIYKYHAYRKAARALEEYGKRVKSGAEAQKLSGIGPKISQKIEDFLKGATGDEDGDVKPQKSDEAEISSPKTKSKSGSKSASKTSEGKPSKKAKNDLDQLTILDHYQKFYGMTKIDAMKLKIDGIKTISDLKNQKSLLTKAQLVCLEHFEDLCSKIPRDDMKKFEKIVRNAVKKLSNENISVEMTGAYRRRLQESDQIDVLIVDSSVNTETDPDAGKSLKKTLKKIISTLVEEKLFVEHIALEDDRKVIGLIRLDKNEPCRRISIFCVAQNQFPCSLFHTTGDENFVEKIVNHCLDNGFVLRKESLHKIGLTGVIGLPIKLENETELFQYIDHPFVEPKHRNLLNN